MIKQHKLVYLNNLDDNYFTLDTENKKIKYKINTLYENLIKCENGLLINKDRMRNFIQSDRNIMRTLSGQDIMITFMQEFLIYGNANQEPRAIENNSISRFEKPSENREQCGVYTIVYNLGSNTEKDYVYSFVRGRISDGDGNHYNNHTTIFNPDNYEEFVHLSFSYTDYREFRINRRGNWDFDIKIKKIFFTGQVLNNS